MPGAVVGVQIHIRGLDEKLPAVRHRVAGVHRQVDHDLLELAGVDLYQAKVLAGDCFQFDVLPDQANQHLAQIGDQDVEVQNLRLDDLLAGERQQLLGQCGRPLRSLVRLGEQSRNRIGRGELQKGQGNVSYDGRQQVVEVVRHTPCQATHRLHLHRLLELGLQLLFLLIGPLAVGDVPNRRYHQPLVRNRRVPCGDESRLLSLTGNRHIRPVHALRVAAGAIFQYSFPDLLPEFRIFVNGVPKRVRFGKRLSCRAVEPGKVVVHVIEDHGRVNRIHGDAHGKIVHDRPGEGCAFPQRFLRQLTLGDVVKGPQSADNGTITHHG